MPRSWPPKANKYPIVFKSGDNTTGLSKSFSPTLTKNVEMMLAKSSHFFETNHSFHFDVSYYFPNNVIASDERVNNMVIMLNGLNEIHNYHMDHYDRIGTALARKGLGAALYPTPFHLNRSAFIREEKREAYESREGRRQKWPKAHGTKDMKRHPANSLFKHPASIFYCFEQTAKELYEFTSHLKRERHDQTKDSESFFKHHLDRNTEISLLGYSMGGLQALFTFLTYPNLFKRCILINSGVTIDELKTKPVGISEQDWQLLLEKIKNEFPIASKHLLNPELLNEVLFGFKERQNGFESQAHNILFISGGADKVADKRHLDKLPATEGLNVIQLHGLQHPLKSPVFDRWFPVISDAIHSFVSTPKTRIVSAEALVDKLLKFEIQEERWDIYIRRNGSLQESPFVSSNNLLINDVHAMISSNADEFLKYIMMSKRYYKDDAELLRAIERRSNELKKMENTNLK